MEEPERLHLEARAENLERVFDWIASVCRHVPSTSGDLTSRLQLVVEELFLNVVNHGQSVANEHCSFMLTLYLRSAGTVLIVEDTGPKFNPLASPAQPDVNAPLEDRPIGGLGVMLVQEMTDDITYERVENLNRLTLVFDSGLSPQDLSSETDSETPGAKSSTAQGVDMNKFSTCAEPESGDPARNTEAASHHAERQTRQRHRWRLDSVAPILGFFLGFVVLTGFGIGAVVVLNFLKFESLFTKTVAARYDPVLRELHHAINESLRDGLTLASTRSTQDLLDRASEQFEDGFVLVVRDADSTVLFQTGEIGQPLISLPTDGDIQPESVGADRFIRHMSIMQNGTVVGTISLSHHQVDIVREITAMRQELEDDALFTFSLSLIPMFFLAIAMAFHIKRRFSQKADILEDVDLRSEKSLSYAIRSVRQAL